MPDLPEISDEMVEGLAQAMRDTNLPDVWDPQLPQRVPMGVFACVALDWLVASGWRPEADVLREAAEKLRSAAAGRREYAESLRRDPAFEDVVGMLDLQADTIEAAARVAEGDLGPLYNWLPSRRWTDQMVAKLHGDWATALDPAQPLPVADGSGQGQERSEEIEHG